MGWIVINVLTSNVLSDTYDKHGILTNRAATFSLSEHLRFDYNYSLRPKQFNLLYDARKCFYQYMSNFTSSEDRNSILLQYEFVLLDKHNNTIVAIEPNRFSEFRY